LSLGLLVLVLVVGVTAVVRSQRAYLIRQVDRQLEIIRPMMLALPQGDQLPDFPANSDIQRRSFYVATRNPDGSATPWSLDAPPGVVPDLTRVETTSLSPGRTFTVSAVGSSTMFRVMSIVERGDRAWLVAALPLDTIERAQRRLSVSLLALAVVIVVALVLAGWWVVRLGLRPIEQLTRVSEAVVGGDRSQRSSEVRGNTESAKLGRAFNLMLDERDDVEGRLRQFVADASHELRTPLTSIRGFLDAFANGRFESPPDRADAMRRINREVSRMHHLAEDLLLLAELDRERPLHRTNFDLTQLMTDVAEDAMVLHPSRTIEPAGNSADPITVSADLIQIQQVLIAVMHNATTHTFADTTIRFGVHRERDLAVVTVSDDGPGIRHEDLDRVFERFYRTDASRARNAGGGSGLGLAIAKAVVNAHAGSISVVSSPGSGCRFEIRLPLGPPTNARAEVVK
jgi:two-component system, OmpR family, sensor kinase